MSVYRTIGPLVLYLLVHMHVYVHFAFVLEQLKHFTLNSTGIAFKSCL